MVFSYRLCCEAFLSATYTDMLAPAMGSMFLADAVDDLGRGRAGGGCHPDLRSSRCGPWPLPPDLLCPPAGASSCRAPFCLRRNPSARRRRQLSSPIGCPLSQRSARGHGRVPPSTAAASPGSSSPRFHLSSTS